MKAKSESSTSTPNARKGTAETSEIHNALEPSSTALAVPEAVASSGSNFRLNELYNSADFRLAWANEISFRVAQNVIHLRRYRRLSQGAVAETMGTSQSAVARIEGGDENITLRTLRRLVVALRGRLRVTIEPEEAELPSWPPWWETIGSPAATTLTRWVFHQAVTHQEGTQLQVLAGWYSLSRDTLPAGGQLLGLSEARAS